MWGDAKYRDFNDALSSKGTHQDLFDSISGGTTESL